jgi:predicted RNase H-like HicB family nuclease
MAKTAKQTKDFYTVVFRPEPEGGFTAYVPVLPGCISYGKNITEAKKMIREAIEGYLIVMKKEGEKVPSDAKSFIDRVAFTRTYA